MFCCYPSQRSREREKDVDFLGVSVVFRYLCRQMKRTICFLLWSLLAIGVMQALPLSRDAARQRAVSFLAARRAAARAAEPTPEPALVETASPCSALYVFNVGSDEGFVLVSADDRSEAVLGYAESGSFDVATLPDNARAWIVGLATLYGVDGQDGQFGLSGQKGQCERAAVRPLLTTQWAQKWPYNLLCPKNMSTGCIATAMAQIMKHYEWPQSETTTIPAYGNYEELPPTSFEWGSMEAGYGGNEPDESCHSVALLMKYCGWAVQMSYGSSSSAYSESIPEAMYRFFGYDGGVRCVYRSDYSVSAWDELLYGELSAGRPVIYGAQRSSGSVQVGHDFVCDGYDGQGFYHINWGWGGISDGWYRLSFLFPPYVGTGAGSGLNAYSMYHIAIVGIQPDYGGTPPVQPALLTAEEMRVMSGPVINRSSADKSFQLNICCPMANHTSETIRSSFGLALMQNGQLVSGSERLSAIKIFDPGSYIYRNTGQPFSFGSRLTGTFRIVPVCNVTRGLSTELQVAQGANTYYIDVLLTDTSLTWTEHPVRALEVSDVRFRLKGDTIEATANVTNHGDEYNGQLCLMVNGNCVAKIGVNICAGESEGVTFRSKGNWRNKNYMISYSEDDTEWLAEGPVNYTIDNAQRKFTVWYVDGHSEMLELNDNGIAVVPSHALAVDFGKNAPTAIVPNENPNCLYYILSSTKATEGLTNLVTKHYVSELTLHDGYNFYCPMDFTAGHVAYTRTFTNGYDGKGSGWDTIVLPFDVETVMTGEGQQIDWFRSPQEKDKDFWLMTLEGGNGANLTFSHAQQMEANRPYLIAVPGTAYGARSLQGCSVTFSADHAVVHETALTADDAGEYSFVGRYGQDGISGLVGQEVQTQWWLLNEIGWRFRRSIRPIGSFRATLLGR